MKILKLISLILLLTLGISSCNKEEAERNYNGNVRGLQGSIKSTNTQAYQAIDSAGIVLIGDPITIDAPEFGKKFYNLKGQKQKESISNPDGTIAHRWEYEYNSQGKISFKRTFGRDNKLINESCFHYNHKNQITAITSRLPNGEVDFRWEYKYNKKGQRVEEVNYNAQGKISNKRVYKYDEKGRKSQLIWYDGNNNLQYEWCYSYTKYNQLSQQIGYNPIEESSIVENYRYNKSGELAHQETILEDQSIVEEYTYLYVYDDKGNWIEKIVYSGEKPDYVIIRQIEYYPEQ